MTTVEKPCLVTTASGAKRWSTAHNFTDVDRAASKAPESMAKRLETYRIRREARQAAVRDLMARGLTAPEIAKLLDLRSERIARKVMREVRAQETA